MQFTESTQLLNWSFTADQLRRRREENRQRSLQAIQQARAHSASVASLDTLDSEASAATAAAPTEPPACWLSLEEELSLLKYYSTKLQHVCRELRLPRRVLGTALTYLKRIYLAHTCLDHDPQQLLLTCLYLACKIEEHYISAAELDRLTGVPAELILRTELTALQGLQFDLIVYSPYKSIEAFCDDIKEAAAAAREAGSSSGGGSGGGSGDTAAAATGTEAVAVAEAAAGLDPGTAGLSEQQLEKARAVAYSAADALMLSDAPLLHTPGRLALAAVRSGFNKLGIKLQRYIERVAQRSSGSSSGGSSSSGADGGADGGGSAGWQKEVQRLQAALSELDQLGAEGAQAVDQELVKAVDSKLKQCRGLLMEGGGLAAGKQAAAAKAKAKADKAARKAAKAAEQRSLAEASVGILPAAPPPAKRARHSTQSD